MNVYINGKEYINQFEVNIEPITYFDCDSNSNQIESYLLYMWKEGQFEKIKLPIETKFTLKNRSLFIEFD